MTRPEQLADARSTASGGTCARMRGWPSLPPSRRYNVVLADESAVVDLVDGKASDPRGRAPRGLRRTSTGSTVGDVAEVLAEESAHLGKRRLRDGCDRRRTSSSGKTTRWGRRPPPGLSPRRSRPVRRSVRPPTQEALADVAREGIRRHPPAGVDRAPYGRKEVVERQDPTVAGSMIIPLVVSMFDPSPSPTIMGARGLDRRRYDAPGVVTAGTRGLALHPDRHGRPGAPTAT